MTTKDKDGDIIEIKHHKKIKGEPLYVSKDAFAPEPTIEITEYDYICLGQEAENLQILQCYVIANNMMTIEEVHKLQDTRIDILTNNLIKFQTEQLREMLDEKNQLDHQVEKWSKVHKTLKDKLKSMTIKDFENWQQLEKENNEKTQKLLRDLVREKKSD